MSRTKVFFKEEGLSPAGRAENEVSRREDRRTDGGHREEPAFLVHRIEEQDDHVGREKESRDLQQAPEVVAESVQNEATLADVPVF